MSDESNDDNPTPSCESDSDSLIVLVESSGHTVDLPIGGSSIEESQSLDTSNQAAVQEDAKSRRQEKWKQISKKTYAEISTACPGSKEENFALFGNNHPDSPDEKRLEQHTLPHLFTDEKHSSQDNKSSGGNRQEEVAQESPGSGNAIHDQVS